MAGCDPRPHLPFLSDSSALGLLFLYSVSIWMNSFYHPHFIFTIGLLFTPHFLVFLLFALVFTLAISSTEPAVSGCSHLQSRVGITTLSARWSSSIFCVILPHVMLSHAVPTHACCCPSSCLHRGGSFCMCPTLSPMGFPRSPWLSAPIYGRCTMASRWLCVPSPKECWFLFPSCVPGAAFLGYTHSPSTGGQAPRTAREWVLILVSGSPQLLHSLTAQCSAVSCAVTNVAEFPFSASGVVCPPSSSSPWRHLSVRRF